MSNNFVADYIKNCISEGINNPSDMRSLAEKEIKEIDDKILALNALKQRQGNLRAVIKNLGGNTTKDKGADFPFDHTTPIDNLPDYFVRLLSKVCDEVEACPEGVPSSYVVHDIASLEDHKKGYIAIHWLSKWGIIERNPENRFVIKGPNWENRPKYGIK